MTTTPTHRLLIAACALAFAASVAPQAQGLDWGFGNGKQVRGTGNVQRQARTVGDFSGLSLAQELPGKVEVRSSGPAGVTVEADANLLPLIETVVENGTLRLRSRDKAMLQSERLKIIVQGRTLERLAVEGSGDIDADVVRGGRVQLSSSGSGDIEVDRIEGENATISLSGSGDVKAERGEVRELKVSSAGSGDADLEGVRSSSARVSIAGSGDIKVWAEKTLDVSIAGSGDVNYHGDPQLRKSVAGSGDVRRVGGARR